jgi:hypothetical protein
MLRRFRLAPAVLRSHRRHKLAQWSCSDQAPIVKLFPCTSLGYNRVSRRASRAAKPLCP